MRIILLVSSFLLIGFAVQAQKYNSEYDYLKATFKEDKKEMVGRFLELSEDEAKKFWPIYDEYEKKRAEFGRERWEGLNMYVLQFDEIDDAKGSEWIKNIMDFNERFDAHLKDYTLMVEEAMGGRRAIQFYEIETLFNLEIRSWIYAEFPLVGEFD